MDDPSLIRPTPRTTRSNKIFSPWEIYQVEDAFDFPARVKQRLDRSLSLELVQGIESGDEEDAGSPFSSPLTSPEVTPPSSPISGPLRLTMPLPSISHPPSTTDVAAPSKTDRQRIKERRKASSQAARKKRREKAATSFGQCQVREKIRQHYVRADDTHHTSIELGAVKVPSGGFVGARESGHCKKVYRLDELVGPSSKKNFTRVEWNGEKTVCLVGKDNRVIGILAGNPGCDDWPEVVRQASDAIESRRRRLVTVKGKKNKFRRGKFPALATGVSYGGGQTHPMNVKNHPQNQRILDELSSLSCFQRISGFSSSIMASRTPDLYQHYAQKIGRLYENDPSLNRPFPLSIFCATTYNFGPQTVCYPHLDDSNLAYGKCSITPVGMYDYKRGGHLVLWECKLVVEFPPGSTILIPSAVLTHSNTAIAPSETRYSFTQYTAGALFRWVENGFRTAASFHTLLSSEEIEAEKDKNERRWKEGVALLPILVCKPEATPSESLV